MSKPDPLNPWGRPWPDPDEPPDWKVRVLQAVITAIGAALVFGAAVYLLFAVYGLVFMATQF